MMIFLRFLDTFERSPQLPKKLAECQTNVLEYFPKFSEDFPKILDDCRGRSNYVSIIINVSYSLCYIGTLHHAIL